MINRNYDTGDLPPLSRTHEEQEALLMNAGVAGNAIRELQTII
jgi:hypothetical protein